MSILDFPSEKFPPLPKGIEDRKLKDLYKKAAAEFEDLQHKAKDIRAILRTFLRDSGKAYGYIADMQVAFTEAASKASDKSMFKDFDKEVSKTLSAITAMDMGA